MGFVNFGLDAVGRQPGASRGVERLSPTKKTYVRNISLIYYSCPFGVGRADFFIVQNGRVVIVFKRIIIVLKRSKIYKKVIC